MGSNEIILEIEGTPVTCNKEELITNSDYFKAMLEGNFVERNKRQIKLEGVKLKAMNIILTLLWDDSYIIENEDLLLVLQTACMLQFQKVRSICLEKVTEILSPKNCIKIWHVTEQLDIRPLFLKAKAMALDEFMEIKDSDCILELTLEEIYYYLGNIYLKADNELSVFQTIMKWWYVNNERYEDSPTTLIKLLSCIDYQNLIDGYLKEMMTFPDIADNLEVTQLFSSILLIKNDRAIEDFPETCQKTAKLLYQSKRRILPQFPCILVNYIQLDDKISKKVSQEQKRIVYYDKFGRKRFYELLDTYKKDNLKVVYYDYNSQKFKIFLDIDGKKCQSLDGFKLVGYKEFVFMYGGEFLIGKGNWNYNFWVYDTIRERWERKCVLPFPRRHFETCMVGNNLYIIGGTGVFRVIQENMFWYNYKDDQWSRLIMLPCFGRQLKCCQFSNQLFILNINNKCGYFFNEVTYLWIQKDVILDDSIMSKESEFSVFSYKNSLYIKGRNLIEFMVKDKDLLVVSVKHVTDLPFDKIEVVLCNSIIYTFYKFRYEDQDMYSLETYNLETGDMDFIFKDAPGDAVIDVDGDQHVISSTLKIFAFQHCSLVEESNLINDCFE